MDDVGIFRTTIGIESPAEPGRIAHLPDTLVDTGSEFTWAPRAIVESLGITPQRRGYAQLTCRTQHWGAWCT